MLFTKKSIFTSLLVCLICIFLVLSYSDIFTTENNQPFQLNGNEDHSISLSDAVELTGNFQKQATPEQVIGGYFSREAVLSLLEQEGCIGIRYYYGLDNEGTPHIVLVGVNAEGNDMIDGLLRERSFKCPPFCADPNEINTTLRRIEISANF